MEETEAFKQVGPIGGQKEWVCLISWEAFSDISGIVKILYVDIQAGNMTLLHHLDAVYAAAQGGNIKMKNILALLILLTPELFADTYTLPSDYQEAQAIIRHKDFGKTKLVPKFKLQVLPPFFAVTLEKRTQGLANPEDLARYGPTAIVSTGKYGTFVLPGPPPRDYRNEPAAHWK